MEVEQYFKENQLAIDVVKKKYCHEKENGELENITEMFQDRIAYELSLFESEAIYWQKRWTKDLLEGWYRPGGSILSGVGSKNNISLVNCTTIPLTADSLEALSQCMYDMMKCASKRQGLGVELGVLRHEGAIVNNAAEQSTGAVPWGEWLQNSGNYVGQKGRIPAILLSLNVSHPDIFRFCRSKNGNDKINNANISVQITDAFMDAVLNDQEWNLHFETRHEKFSKSVPAKEIFELISEQAWQSAEPGVQFIDLMQKGSMIHSVYLSKNVERFKIISTNACSEKPLAAYGSCVLGSLNMGMFPNDPEEYKPILREKVEALTRMLDNAVSYEIQEKRYGVEEQREMLELTRELGMGFTNLHQWFVNAEVQYDSEIACSMIEEFQKWYSYYALEASQALAEEKKPAAVYYAYKKDINNQDLMHSSFFRNLVNEFYDGDPDKVKPLRNLALISIAPTGTLSMTFPEPVLSYGAEPFTGPCWWKKTRALNQNQEYDYYFVFPKVVKDFVLSKITDETQRKIIESVNESQQDNTGEIGNTVKSIIHENVEGFFKPSHEIDPLMKIKMMGGIYKWVDACVSTTYNLPADVPKEVVGKIYESAWKHGVRAVSIYRDTSRGEGILLFDFKKKDQQDKSYCVDRPDEIIFTCAPKRNQDEECDIHHCKVQGKDWVVLVGLKKGYPFEIFAGEANKEEMYIPSTVKKGILRKTGQVYSLIIPIRGTEVEYKNIAEVFIQKEHRALTRLMSLGLRHGAMPVFISTQLKKADEGITSFSSVTSRVFMKYMKKLDYEYLATKDECPDCGGTSFSYAGGCKTCITCNISKCE